MEAKEVRGPLEEADDPVVKVPGVLRGVGDGWRDRHREVVGEGSHHNLVRVRGLRREVGYPAEDWVDAEVKAKGADLQKSPQDFQ